MSCGCPPGFILNDDTGFCEKTVIADAAINANALYPTSVCLSAKNMRYGTAVYPPVSSDQFPLIGKNSASPTFLDANSSTISPAILLFGHLWIGGSLATGRLNQAGIGLVPPTGEWQGYIRCVEVTEDLEKYAVAVSSSYGFRIYVDGELAVFYKPDIPWLASDHLHVFRFDLEEGKHSILCEGLSGISGAVCVDQYNYPVDCDRQDAVSITEQCPGVGSFVFEMFKNITPQILSDAYNQNDLEDLYAKQYVNGIGSNISTYLMIGSPTDTGIRGTYSCSTGTLGACFGDGSKICTYTDIVPYGACCFKLINCQSGDNFLTNTNLNAYEGKIIRINEQSGCFLINVETGTCTSPIAVTVSDTFDSCLDCTRKYYKLVDCQGIATSLYTVYDLSDYVDKVIKISGYNVCWIVVEEDPTEDLTEITLITSYNTCEECQ